LQCIKFGVLADAELKAALKAEEAAGEGGGDDD